MHHRCKLDLGFNISISIRERRVRQGIEKHNLRRSFHVSLLWSPPAFWQQKWRRRGESEKAAEEGIRSSSDSFSPSFPVYSSTPPQPRNTPGSPQNLWSDNMLENPCWNRTKPTLSILECHNTEVTGGRGGSPCTATTDTEHVSCYALTLIHNSNKWLLFFFSFNWKEQLRWVSQQNVTTQKTSHILSLFKENIVPFCIL